MELTPEVFQDFISRLRHHNLGDGVDDHCTADPIFIIEKRVIVAGIDLVYGSPYYWTDSDGEARWSDEELAEQVKEAREGGRHLDPFDIVVDDKVTCDDEAETLFEKIGYAEHWEYVGAELTREAAEAFIARRKHNFKGLRINVDSLCWSPELKMIVRALLSGRLGLIEEPNKEQAA